MTNLKLNLKLFATAALLLFLWQDATCGKITLASFLNENSCKVGIKYKRMDALGKKDLMANVLIPRSQTAAFDFDATTESLWAAPEGSSGYWHYSKINIPDNKDYLVVITELYTGMSSYGWEAVCNIIPLVITGEPLLYAYGKIVKEKMYPVLPKKVFRPEDISARLPLYAATFDYTFDDRAYSRPILVDVSSSKILPPEYVIQFPSSVELPTLERNEIVRILKLDPSGDFAKQLYTSGAEIHVRACAFTLKGNDFIIDARAPGKGKSAFVSLFNSNNVIPGTKDPISIDKLVCQTIPVVGCQLTSKVGSFDVVTISEDLKNICVTRVLIGDTCDQVAQLFDAHSFHDSVSSLASVHAKTYVALSDYKALSDTAYSLSKMSGNPLLRPVAPSEVTFTASSTMTYTPQKEVSAEDLMSKTGPNAWHAPYKYTGDQWVKMTFTTPTILHELKMRSQDCHGSGSEGHLRAPKAFIFQGSNDDSTWTDLLKVSNSGFTTPGEWKTWTVLNSVSYKYYRIYITSSIGNIGLLTIGQVAMLKE